MAQAEGLSNSLYLQIQGVKIKNNHERVALLPLSDLKCCILLEALCLRN